MLIKLFRIFVYIPVILNIEIVYPSVICQKCDFNNVENVSLTSEKELMIISEEIFIMSSHELFNQVHINYQGHICSNNFTDNASQRLLNTSSKIFSTLTTKSLVKLFDNYEFNTYEAEDITKEEDLEENEFIVNLLKTDTMLHVMHFLSTKGFFKNDLKVYKNILKEIWFHLYSRSKNVNGTSGFEHVFVGESKPRKGIIGLHNWISFLYGELSNKINYFGFGRNKEFVHKVVILEAYFTYNGKRKMSTMFIGTAPELEIALYTLCFFTRPNKKCNLSFTGYKFGIKTYIIQNNGMKFVGTAFPIFL